METLATFDTVNTADCVEACPVAGFESSLVVATYQLHKAVESGETGGDRRSGTLQRFQLDCNGATGSTDRVDVTVCKVEDVVTSSGVFDIKWNTQAMHDRAMLGVATAGGSIELYELTESENEQTLRSSGLATDADADSMCLSLDWNNRVHASAQPSICASHSNGYVRRSVVGKYTRCTAIASCVYHLSFLCGGTVVTYRSGTSRHKASSSKLR